MENITRILRGHTVYTILPCINIDKVADNFHRTAESFSLLLNQNQFNSLVIYYQFFLTFVNFLPEFRFRLNYTRLSTYLLDYP